MKSYNNETIKNVTVSYKIDGVQLRINRGVATSRAGKELYGIPNDLADGIYEIYLGSWEKSISACRTKIADIISEENIYQLHPILDKRLFITQLDIATPDIITELMKKATNSGYEGIVLRPNDSFESFIKVKPTLTVDAVVVDIIEGEGKNIGKLGAFITTECKVGSGFTDKQRCEYFTKEAIGKIIEIKAMERNIYGNLRHPVFLRIRDDLK